MSKHRLPWSTTVLLAALALAQIHCGPLERLAGPEGPVVLVAVSSPGDSQGSLQGLVAAPLEHELGDVSDVVSIASQIEGNTVELRLTFAPGSDLADRLLEVPTSVKRCTTATSRER